MPNKSPEDESLVGVSEGREREISFVLRVVGIAESRRFGYFVARALGLRSSSYFR
jgi:hypothetical protein